MSLQRTPSLADKTKDDENLPPARNLFSDTSKPNPSATNSQYQANAPQLYGPFPPTGDPPAASANPPHPIKQTQDYYLTISRPQLPVFMRDRPDIWFCLAESEFEAHGTWKDNIKYSTVLKALDKETLLQITDLIHDPPTNNRYESLKTTVIERLSDSRHKDVNKLLHDLVLGDKKPSQLLREMKDLSKGGVADDVLHSMWLRRLPVHIQPILAASEEVGLNGLAVMADRVIDTGTASHVLAVSNKVATPSDSYMFTQISRIEQRIEEFSVALTTCLRDIAQLKTQGSQFKPRYRSRSRTPNRSGICYYYQRFGEAATRCTTPCNYKPKSENQ